MALGLVENSARTAHVDGAPYRVVAVRAGAGQAFVLAQSMESTQATLDRPGADPGPVLPRGVIVAGVAGWLVASNGLRPVRRLTAATERVTATRDLTPIEVSGKEDELARLTRSFNEMLEALSATQRRERQLIADAGHELRTPLTSAWTNIDLLRQVSAASEGTFSAEQRRELLDDVTAQLSELTTLVGDLTELARDEPLHRDPEPLDLADVVNRAVGRVQLRAPSVNFDVLLDSSGGRRQPVVGARDHQPAGQRGEVESRGRHGRGATRRGAVTVRDHGPGIAPEDLPHVFERFYRSTEARTLPGSGLGLPIVQRAAERHGGHVSVDSAPGEGDLHLRGSARRGLTRGRGGAVDQRPFRGRNGR